MKKTMEKNDRRGGTASGHPTRLTAQGIRRRTQFPSLSTILRVLVCLSAAGIRPGYGGEINFDTDKCVTKMTFPTNDGFSSAGLLLKKNVLHVKYSKGDDQAHATGRRGYGKSYYMLEIDQDLCIVPPSSCSAVLYLSKAEEQQLLVRVGAPSPASKSVQSISRAASLSSASAVSQSSARATSPAPFHLNPRALKFDADTCVGTIDLTNTFSSIENVEVYLGGAGNIGSSENFFSQAISRALPRSLIVRVTEKQSDESIPLTSSRSLKGRTIGEHSQDPSDFPDNSESPGIDETGRFSGAPPSKIGKLTLVRGNGDKPDIVIKRCEFLGKCDAPPTAKVNQLILKQKIPSKCKFDERTAADWQ